MTNSSYSLKSKKLIEETLDVLRNKPVVSTCIDRIYRLDEAFSLYGNTGLPQPLVIGYGMLYMFENVACPVEPHDILVSRCVDRVPNEEEQTKITEIKKNNPFFLNDSGHLTFDWFEILKLGINGLLNKCRNEIVRRIKEGANSKNIVFLQGMELVYTGYKEYIMRYGYEAEKCGLDEAANACKNISENPPCTFFEAIQLILLITNAYNMYSARMNPTITYGRIDELLLPYYENDLKNGNITEEKASYIIDDFNCKSAMILGRGEHQMSHGPKTDWYRNPAFDSPTYAIIGGKSLRNPDGNPLTAIFAKHIIPRFENPVYIFRHTNSTSSDIWNIICEKIRMNSTVIVYNDETEIQGFLNSGIPYEDAVDYTIHGCNWPDVHGAGGRILSAGGPIPQYIMRAIFDENGRPRKSFSSIDEIYSEIASEWRNEIHRCCESMRNIFSKNKPSPLPEILTCSDCFLNGPLDNANSRKNAIKYPLVYVLMRNIGTATDIMSALESLLFSENPISIELLADALAADFNGYDEILKRCFKAPKYGTDNDIADSHAVRIMNLLTDIVDSESISPQTGLRDVHCLNVTITDMGHIPDGERMGATPDGRRAHAPLSENLSPTVGYATSVTALLNSVSKLPFNKFTSGTLNIKIPFNLISGDDGLLRLKSLLDIYFENGGMQIQLNIADAEELKDAQIHPELHRDLMVRITGYSAVFIDMGKNAQDEVIRRDDLS